MKVDRTLSVATVAAEIPGSREVFEKFGIDYAGAGARSMADAAHEQGIDPELLLASVRALVPADQSQSWSERPLVDLVQHLVREHHRFVREELAMISFRMWELCAPPARPVPDLQSLRAALTRLSDTLLGHMHEEEDNVFPRIEALEASWQANESRIDEELAVRIGHIVTEHGTIAAQLRTIRELRQKLEVGDDAPALSRPTLEAIARLEAHLHEYLFLENCILFPRAVALQEQMTAV